MSASLFFQRIAAQAFRFLVEEWGFEEIVCPDTHIAMAHVTVERRRYQSGEVMVEISYTGQEVDVYIDEVPPSYSFQLSLFLHAYHHDVWEDLGLGIAFQEESVTRELESLADALRKYGRPLLEHNRAVFEKMKTVKWWELPGRSKPVRDERELPPETEATKTEEEQMDLF